MTLSEMLRLLEKLQRESKTDPVMSLTVGGMTGTLYVMADKHPVFGQDPRSEDTITLATRTLG